MSRALLFAAIVLGTFTGFALLPQERQLPLRPGFALPALSGEQRSISEWDGQVVLLNFWAPWCPPCREEIPDFVELQHRYRDEGFTVVALAVDSVENTRAFLAQVAVNFPVLVGEMEGIALAGDYGNDVGALPFTVIIDREGRITARYFRKLTLGEAEQAVRPLL